MKFFHLSDLHLGVKLLRRDLLADQEYVLEQVISLAQARKPDAVVIAGDIYDKAVPPAEAVALFDWFLTALREKIPQCSIMIISGNHDSAPRLNCFRSVLDREKVYMIGLPPQRPGEKIANVCLKDSWGMVVFHLLPFIRPAMVRQAVLEEGEEGPLSYEQTLRRLLAQEQLDPAARHVLVSHQFYLPAGKSAKEIERMDSEIQMVGNIDAVPAELLAPFDYAALGHIHKPMTVGEKRFRYCGTPLAVSVSEAGQQKAVLEVELREKGNITVTPLTLTPLRPVQILRGSLEEVLCQSCEAYVSVVLTDPEDLEVMDLQQRLRAAFPYLLEIRREGEKRRLMQEEAPLQEQLSPLSLCRQFLGELTWQEERLLADVIHTVEEGEQK